MSQNKPVERLTEEEMEKALGALLENQELLHKRLDELADWTHAMNGYMHAANDAMGTFVQYLQENYKPKPD